MKEFLERPGCHVVTYYYSKEHLLVKSAAFLHQGLEKGEKCYFTFAPAFCTELEETLVRMGVNLEEVKLSGQLQSLDFSELYKNYKTDGARGMAFFLKQLNEEDLKEHFSGTRILMESGSGVLKELPQSFSKWENDFSQAVLHVPITALCLYDVNHLLHVDGRASDFIGRTLSNHSYVYFDCKIMEQEDLKRRDLEGVS